MKINGKCFFGCFCGFDASVLLILILDIVVCFGVCCCVCPAFDVVHIRVNHSLILLPIWMSLIARSEFCVCLSKKCYSFCWKLPFAVARSVSAIFPIIFRNRWCFYVCFCVCLCCCFRFFWICASAAFVGSRCFGRSLFLMGSAFAILVSDLSPVGLFVML